MNVHELVRPRRDIVGMSAVLLPFTAEGAIDWAGLEDHVARTADSGLIPAVNMDTGFGPTLTPSERTRVLELTKSVVPSEFVAGAHVDDAPGATFAADAYRSAIAEIADVGG